ncbi:right-handed parallel beta-helix repeat-containing protein [Sphingomonas sp.]|uniref:right-handed parallel beta-helix repeat-containing protein n=1 Tax=Sphingomonas sp. TaxID=28214 RepID=UPI0035BC365A
MIRLLPLLLLTAAASPAPFTVGDRGFATLQAAVDAIGGGAATIVVAPGVYRQCAVQTRGRVTYRAAQLGTAIFEREACEDKAALVLRGSGSTVDGLVFRGYRVADGNGAGIRSETGDLTVVNATFLDSQQGIGGGEPARQQIAIDHSTFAGLGQCDEAPNCSHAIYLGNRGSVTITRSRFERGTGGHYVKLRSPQVAITDNSFDDTAGAKTNYMIDLPEGATGLIARNVFVQGAHKENGSALIAVRAESHTYPSAGLRIEDNQATLGAGQRGPTTFVADWSHERLAIGANRLGAGVKAFDLR